VSGKPDLHARGWRAYYDEATLARADEVLRSEEFGWEGERLAVDLYPQQDPAAPTILFNHGGGAHSRMMVTALLELYERGYTVIAPNQVGHGPSTGPRGRTTVTDSVRCIVAAARHYHARARGPFYLGGYSLGGGLAWAAHAAGAPAEALVLHCLTDFGRINDAVALSRWELLNLWPPAAWLAVGPVRAGAKLAPGALLDHRFFGRFERMADPADGPFYARWREDPWTVKEASFRSLASLTNTPSRRPLEANTTPALVLNPARDRLLDPVVTWRNAARLGGAVRYVELEWGHWSITREFAREWGRQVAEVTIGDNGGSLPWRGALPPLRRQAKPAQGVARGEEAVESAAAPPSAPLPLLSAFAPGGCAPWRSQKTRLVWLDR
jgi:pimeloyl-ACP methyl ester carboxylesterase